MKLLRRLLAAAVFVAVLVLGWRFAADHSSFVELQLPGLAPVNLTLWMALLLAFGLGVVVVAVFAFFRIAHYKLVGRRYRKVIRGLESEVHQLRNLPLAEGDDSAAGPSEAAEVPAAGRALGRGA